MEKQCVLMKYTTGRKNTYVEESSSFEIKKIYDVVIEHKKGKELRREW